MAQLTPEELSALSGQFLAVSKEIMNYRMANSLNDDQDGQLDELQTQLTNNATQLAMQSAIDIGDEANVAIGQLNQITTHISQTIQSLSDVQKVINIAAASLKVVASIVSMNPEQIAGSIQGLATACNIKIA